MPKSEYIIVAVIDSGVDVNHEDLQGHIWTNAGEVANDGIDNDGNGYIDDVFGWNFIGGANGMATIVKDETLKNGIRLVKGDPAAQIDADSLEITRELVRMKKLKLRLEELGESLTAAQAAYLDSLTKEVGAAVQEAKEVVTTFSGHLKKYKAAELALISTFISDKNDPYEWFDNVRDTTRFFRNYEQQKMKFALQFINDSTAEITDETSVSKATWKIDDQPKSDEKPGIFLRLSMERDEQLIPGQTGKSTITFSYKVLGIDDKQLFLETPNMFNSRKMAVLMKTE